MRQFTLLLLFLIPFKLLGQQTELVFLDSTNQQSIESVVLNTNNGKNLYISDAKGKIKIDIPKSGVLISCSRLGYKPIQKWLPYNKETFQIKILLVREIETLPLIEVSSERRIDTLFQEPYSVVDYEFWEDKILLLAFLDHRSKFSLILIDDQGNLLAKELITKLKPQKLHKSCLGGIHLVEAYFSYEISLTDTSIQLKSPESLEAFNTFIQPCILATDDALVYKNSYYQGQAVQYVSYSKTDSSKQTIASVIHEESVDRLISEAGLKGKNYGEYFSEDVHWKIANLRSAPKVKEGDWQLFYPNIKTPIFHFQDSVYLFDHVHNILFLLNKNGDTIKEIAIQYHLLKKWSGRVVFDQDYGKAYTLFHTKWGYAIGEINLSNGKLETLIPFKRDFPENFQIRDGYLYFLFRINHGTSRYLHKIALNE